MSVGLKKYMYNITHALTYYAPMTDIDLEWDIKAANCQDRHCFEATLAWQYSMFSFPTFDVP